MGGLLDAAKLLWSITLGRKLSSGLSNMEKTIPMTEKPIVLTQSEPLPTTTTMVGVSEVEPSANCIALIKQFEGCRLSTYQDSVGIPTIGYGHTAGVVLGSTISQEEAEWFLKTDLRLVAKAVRKLLQVPVNQNQFDALCCFSFNVGVGNLAKSTLLKQINNGNINKASEEFLKWNKAGGVELKGLTSRRKAEKALFERTGI